RRAGERIEESLRDAALRVRGLTAPPPRAAILNVSAASVAPRTGGVAVQLLARLACERESRDVALLHPGGLRVLSPAPHRRRIAARGFEESVREAMAICGARAMHLEGTFGAPLDALLRLIQSGVAVIVSVHDFSLASETAHLDAAPSPRPHARELLASASGLIFPSQFLLERHRELFDLPLADAEVIEPATPAARVELAGGEGIAFAGSVQRHKGAHLLPDVARQLAERGLALHVFGGGDGSLFRELRRASNVTLHGWYRAGALPSLLARHRIGVLLLPSIVPESYSLTLSEAWLAGVPVIAFDHGAVADRIRAQGGGHLAPLSSAFHGLVAGIDRWRAGDRLFVPPKIITPHECADMQMEWYRRRGWW
ncbi:MAG TPA: glycosyltransferase, partial [Thermoanaerobaculia bacterium]|nr:glycosyltransferase [Thermoanaerobaculia bacterium]